MAKVLIVDDERDVCTAFEEAVQNCGHEPFAVHSLSRAKECLEELKPEVVFLDVGLPDGSGLEELSEFIQSEASPEVVIVTGAGNPDGAESALVMGAFDYIQKPVGMHDVKLTLVRALEYRGARISRQQIWQLKYDGVVGKSKAMHECLQKLADATFGDHGVLITGETGTGKELLAKAVHENSKRKEGNFVILDCTVLTESLAESTLFGHKKGAFTGAVSDQQGLLQQADQGTLFLDEVGELSLELQKKFLRAMESKTFRPVGSKKELSSDFRVVSATNKDLQEMVNQGLFRQDLLFRLQTCYLEIPPLRERVEDLEDIIDFCLRKICKRMKLPLKEADPEFIALLAGYEWPGNVRELINVLDQSVAAAANEDHLHCKHLPLNLRIQLMRESMQDSKSNQQILTEAVSPFVGNSTLDWKSFRSLIYEAAEERYFKELYKLTNGEVKKMAELAGVTKSRVYGILKKLSLEEV